MSTTRNPDLLIKAFLDEGVDQLPDRSFDAARAAIDQTRQWAVIGPWKEAQIMNATRFALIAAAIAVVAVVAIRFLPTTNIGPGPSPTPTVQSAASPAAVPSHTPAAAAPGTPLPLASPGAIGPGTYSMGTWAPVPVTFQLYSDWTLDGNGIVRKGSAGQWLGFSAWAVDHVFADACHWTGTSRQVSTAADIVAALAAQTGREVTPPVDVTLDGRSAQKVHLYVPEGSPPTCDGGGAALYVRNWTDPNGDESGGWASDSGQIDDVYVVDVDGTPLVLVATSHQYSDPGAAAELQQIINSVRLPEIAAATPTPTATPRVLVNSSTAVPLPAGRYVINAPNGTRVPVTFTLPAGWSSWENQDVSKGGSPTNPDAETAVFAVWIVDTVYKDTCHWKDQNYVTGLDTRQKIVDALTAQANHDASTPAQVTFAGKPATHLTMSVPVGFDESRCDQSFMRVWPDAGPNELYGWPTQPGEVAQVYVVDTSKGPIVVFTAVAADASAADSAEAAAILESAQIEDN